MQKYVKKELTGYEPPTSFIKKLEEDPETFNYRLSMHLVRMEYRQAWKYNEKIKDEIRELNDPGSVFYVERFYVNIHKNKLMCYLPDKKYYNKILKAYSNIVTECRGPWNKKHVDILIDHDQSVAVRTKNYWNKYNITFFNNIIYRF